MLKNIFFNKLSFYVDNSRKLGYKASSLNKQLVLIFLGLIALVASVLLGFIGLGILAMGLCYLLSGFIACKDRLFPSGSVVIMDRNALLLGLGFALIGFVIMGFGIFLTYLQFSYPNLINNKHEVSTPKPADLDRSKTKDLNESPKPESRDEFSGKGDQNFETLHEMQSPSVSFRSPRYLDDLIKSKEFHLEVNTEEDLVSKYKSYGVGGCPATCGLLAGDDKLLQSQFDILRELESQQHCTFSKDYIDRVKHDFILFSNAISNKIDVGSLLLNNGRCALRIIESDGFDVSILNFYYKAVFTDKDKIYLITFKLFPTTRGIRVVDELWDTLGRKDNSCNEGCYLKESTYFSRVNKKDPIVQEVTKIYDEAVKTIEY